LDEIAQFDLFKNNEAVKEYKETVRNIEGSWKARLTEWEARNAVYVAQEAERIRNVGEKFHNEYMDHKPEAVKRFCEIVLGKLKYPDIFPGKFQVLFESENGILIVDFELPTPDDIPNTKSAKYIAARDEIQETDYKPAEKRRLYDSIVYQTALRTIHEVFAADTAGAVKSVVFNGLTHSIDKSTGREVSAYIISVHASRGEFLEFDLSKVDPAKCIRRLRGVAATTLYELTAIQPVIAFKKDDPRIVEGKEVIANISGGDNLAAMDWEQFEHLVRELFEKEFASHGAEVRVTRASRDGGVDALIFDPDPIKGGKFVVQAKRYTSLVPVSAVRDLYGTVVNEGANRGFLVTTSYFGPDSYEFAKDKPITLIDGSNLLSMLQKYGVKAHIDLAAAKKLLQFEGIGDAP